MDVPPQPLPQGEKLHGKLPADLGEWLFKDKDHVLGPVVPELLLTKLYEGFLTADTPVAQEMGQWKPLREIWFLGPHVLRAQQCSAYTAAVQERVSAAQRHARTRLLLGAASFALMLVSSLGAARWTMITRPWEDKTDWVTRRAEVVKLPDRTPRLSEVVVTQPAAKRETVEERHATPEPNSGGKASKDSKGKDKERGRPGKDDKHKAEPAASTPEKGKTPEPAAAEPPKPSGPAPQDLTKEQMLATFKTGVPAYKACISEEATRNEDMPGTITVEFVVTNEGTTKDFKVQERDIRDGALAKCLAAKVATLRFSRFTGEVKTFIFPFKITRKT